MPDESPAGHDPGEDVRFTLEQVGEWIRSADTKAGLLAPTLALLMSPAFGNFNKRQLTNFLDSPREFIGASLFVGFGLTFGMAAFFVAQVLIPRTQHAVRSSRYSWPWLCDADLHVLTALSPAESREEAWAQAKNLAQIAQWKHKYFKLALRTTIINAVLLIAWLFITAW
ncbi:hypothetical protein G3I18_28415 [Actinospica acidiphila]|uniref:Pycsar effector protein domain-containing protein n=1 Tax=Actinospica acidiphila TaxID=304899 RepID=A0A9X5CPV8_9ACTN|nr:hypothetical protein [Actinospica acidiphila]NEC52449.1 hypothetical protein [Actinospica acidiphila]